MPGALAGPGWPDWLAWLAWPTQIACGVAPVQIWCSSEGAVGWGRSPRQCSDCLWLGSGAHFVFQWEYAGVGGDRREHAQIAWLAPPRGGNVPGKKMTFRQKITFWGFVKFAI